VDELAHGRADVGLARLAVGLEALAEGADGGVEGQGRQHGHVQRLAQHRVAGLGEAGLPGPLARLAQPRGEAREGHGLLGAVEAPVVGQQGQQPGGGGGADAGDGLKQRGLLLQAGVVVDVAADGFADGLDFLLQRGEHGLDGAGDGGVDGGLPVLLHALHLQQVFEAAQQGLQLADFCRRRRPGGRAHGQRVAGDQLGVRLVGLGPAQLALGEGGDPRRVDDADMMALRDEEVGQRQAVGPGGLHADVRRFRPEARQPPGEAGESLGGVVELLVLVLAVRAEAGGVEAGFGDVDADGGQECDDGHGFPLGLWTCWNGGWQAMPGPCAAFSLRAMQARPARRGPRDTVRTQGRMRGPGA